MIKGVNREKRLDWAKQYLYDDFYDVIWTDETTVQLDTQALLLSKKWTKAKV